MAQADLATRDMMLQSALQQVEQTRMEANRQVRYLTIPVRPVPSEEATYPRKFENTILAFLIFSGIYLMISLTASILREPYSSTAASISFSRVLAEFCRCLFGAAFVIRPCSWKSRRLPPGSAR